jgi:hypothetical protein
MIPVCIYDYNIHSKTFFVNFNLFFGKFLRKIRKPATTSLLLVCG